MKNIGPATKLLAIAVVSVMVGTAIHFLRSPSGPPETELVGPEPVPSVPEAPEAPPSSAVPTPAPEPEIPEWSPVPSLNMVDGTWVATCGDDSPSKLSAQGSCGVSLKFIHQMDKDLKKAGYKSLYAWRLELKKPGSQAPTRCGLREELEFLPNSAKDRDEWRLGFCQGGGFGESLTAQKVYLYLRSSDRSFLKFRMGSENVILSKHN